MSSSQDELLFTGVSGLSCEDFIRGVRGFSLKEGRHKDDEWIAISAGSFMGGSALRWYEALDYEVQESWKLLRRAMLNRWPENPETAPVAAPIVISPRIVVPASFTIPTPAAVPPAAAAQPPVSNGQMRSGRIKILENGRDVGYLAGPQEGREVYTITSTVSTAVLVRFAPSHKACDLLIVNPTSPQALQQKLGLVIADETLQGSKVPPAGVTKAIASGDTLVGDIVTFSLLDSGRWAPPGTGINYGPQKSTVWLPVLDGTILAFWEADSNTSHTLDVCLFKHDGNISVSVTSSYNGLLDVTQDEGMGPDKVPKVTLKFDPV